MQQVYGRAAASLQGESKVCWSRDRSPPDLCTPVCFLKGLILHSIDSFCFILSGLLKKKVISFKGKFGFAYLLFLGVKNSKLN